MSVGDVPLGTSWQLIALLLETKLTATLPSNLRSTTRECLHLVTRGHFGSRDKDGGHATGSAIAKNPMLHANVMALCFIENELLPIEVGVVNEIPESFFVPNH